MNREELRTWLGFRRADVLVYLAMVAIIAVFLVNHATLEGVLAAVAVLLTLAACPLGMKSSPGVSRVTNAAKRIAYPCAVLAACIFIGIHYVGYYVIPQNGMYPTLPAGSRFLTLRRAYREPGDVARGDIIVFKRTENGTAYVYIWRVVGLPGDTVQASRDAVSINGVALTHQKVRTDGGLGIYAERNGEATYEIALPERATDPVPPDMAVTVPKDQFFVLGDNRYQAKDSRYLGCIPFEALIGKKW